MAAGDSESTSGGSDERLISLLGDNPMIGPLVDKYGAGVVWQVAELAIAFPPAWGISVTQAVLISTILEERVSR